MKVVFAGPSLPDRGFLPAAPSVAFRPPAALGDVTKAVIGGATVIGLVDGVFENVPSVWHKEILYTLAEGVQVFGAASMGALRAAECAPFGMIGVGTIFAAYASGVLVDDDAVAQVHGPAELDYIALSEPLVNIEATVDVLRARKLITAAEDAGIRRTARATYFKERSYDSVIAATTFSAPRRAAIAGLVDRHRRDLKREEALELVTRVAAASDGRVAPPSHWHFEETQIWRELLVAWSAELRALGADPNSISVAA